MSRRVWATVVREVRDHLEADGVDVDGVPVPQVPVGDLDGSVTDVETELADLGLRSDGVVDPAWAAAIGRHLVAPVRATLRAGSGDVSATTRFSLVEDRVLLVHEAERSRDGQGVEAAQVSAHVDVVLVKVDALWPALRRFLPPLEQLRAGAGSSRPVHDPPRTVLDRADAERMRTGQDLGALAPAARAVARDEEARLVVLVEAWPTPVAPTVVWSRWWSVAGGRLLDVRLRDDGVELVERRPGDVAVELRWALVGAVDATTPVSGGAGARGGAR